MDKKERLKDKFHSHSTASLFTPVLLTLLKAQQSYKISFFLSERHALESPFKAWMEPGACPTRPGQGHHGPQAPAAGATAILQPGGWTVIRYPTNSIVVIGGSHTWI
jgi:hypothetical protein